MAERLEYTVLGLIEDAFRNMKAQPLNLGGVAGADGGIGGPPGGFIGWLPQYRVAYDETEAAYSGILTSGGSLVDNLAHIRYRLDIVESGILIVDDWDGSPTISNVTELTFSGATVTQVAPGHALVVVSGGGTGAALTVKEADGSPIVLNVDTIIFSGASVTDLGSGDVLITISGGGGSGITQAEADSRYLKLDTSNDPLTGALNLDLTLTPDDPAFTININGIEFFSVYGAGNTNILTYNKSPLSLYHATDDSSIHGEPTLDVERYADVGTAEFDTSILFLRDWEAGATYNKGTLTHIYHPISTSEITLAEINPYIPSGGTMVYFNSLNPIGSGGKLLSLANNDVEKVYVTGSGIVNIPAGATYNINGSPHTHLYNPGGRLTLTSATPVTTTELTTQTSIYYTPYMGNVIQIWDGSVWTENGFTELTLALDSTGGHTGYHQSGKNFDLFIANDGGTLRLCSGPAWSSDTSRGTGAGTTELERKDGILTNKVSMTARFGNASGNTITVAANRGTYVGSFRASADGQTELSLKNIYLINYYNRIHTPIVIKEATDFWSTTDTTWHSWNSSTANRANILFPFTEFEVELYFAFGTQEPAGWAAFCGIALDATNTNSSQIGGPPTVAAAGNIVPGFTIYRGFPGIGFHFLQLTEKAAGTGTTYFYGDQGLPSDLQFGATGWCER